MTQRRPELATWADADELAEATARRLVRRLAELQADGRVPSVVLTGGSVAARIHRAVLGVAEHGTVDWSRVEIWFGDERYVPADDPERNALQAREALLEHLPLDPARVHEMPAADGPFGKDVEAAAAAYARDIVGTLGDDPHFDVLMLGIGPDGHCASLFPGHEALGAAGLTVAVHDSPKPPPTRISLTMDALHRADAVWFVAAGSRKTQAVAAAFTGSDANEVPAAGPRGRQGTCFLLDADAGAALPRQDVS